METFDVGDLVICPWPHKNGVGIVLAVEETTSNIISLEVLINEEVYYYRDDEVTRLKEKPCLRLEHKV
jgi:hypothetical protein